MRAGGELNGRKGLCFDGRTDGGFPLLYSTPAHILPGLGGGARMVMLFVGRSGAGGGTE